METQDDPQLQGEFGARLEHSRLHLKKIHLYLYLYISINNLWYKHKTQPRLASSSWEGWKEELWLLTFWLAVPEFCPLFKFVRRPVILCLQIAL